MSEARKIEVGKYYKSSGINSIFYKVVWVSPLGPEGICRVLRLDLKTGEVERREMESSLLEVEVSPEVVAYRKKMADIEKILADRAGRIRSNFNAF